MLLHLYSAWIGLAGDAIDLIPFVTGVGETARVVSTAIDIADAVHDVDNGVEVVEESVKLAKYLDVDVIPSTAKTLENIKDASKTLEAGDNYVYVAFKNNQLEYVGITNDFGRRHAEHLANGRFTYEYINGLSRDSARIVEQTVIETFGMSKYGGPLSNRINSISIKNPLYSLVGPFKNSLK